MSASSTDTFTIVRARAGTSGVQHSAGATVKHVLTSDDLNAFKAMDDEAVSQAKQESSALATYAANEIKAYALTRTFGQEAAIEAWADANGISDAYDTKIKSPAQMEKVLKKHGKELPSDLVTTVSSGSTLAVESDPRPAVLQIGKQLTAALSKL